MAVQQFAITVGTTPVMVGDEKTTVTIHNEGNPAGGQPRVFLGGPSVTSGDGLTFQGGADIVFALAKNEVLYAVVDSASNPNSTVLRVLVQG